MMKLNGIIFKKPYLSIYHGCNHGGLLYVCIINSILVISLLLLRFKIIYINVSDTFFRLRCFRYYQSNIIDKWLMYWFYNDVVFFVCLVSLYSITCRNNASISNFRSGFRWQSKYHWYIIQIKSKNFQTVIKKIGKNKKKSNGKRECLCITSFQTIWFFYMAVTQKLITVNTWHFH